MAKRNGNGYSSLVETTEFQNAEHENISERKTENQPIMGEVPGNYTGLNSSSLKDQVEKAKDNAVTEENQPITKMVIIELFVCILSFFGRGMVLGSVGPTLIDLREIASLTVPQGAWIIVSQLTGNFVGSLIAKKVFQEFNCQFALSTLLFLQALCSSLIPAFKSPILMCLMFIGQGLALGVQAIGICAICIRIGGKKRNGMFLQAVYVGISLGGVCGPIIAKPFLSEIGLQHFPAHIHQPGEIPSYIHLHSRRSAALQSSSLHDNVTLTAETSHSSNFTSPTVTDGNIQTGTRVGIYYLIMALVLCVPAISFLLLYCKSGNPIRNVEQDSSQSTSLSIKECTTPLSTAIFFLFIQSMLYFATAETYINLLTTFAVLGPLRLDKADGSHVTSLFYAAMGFGRLNGIWIAKFLSPFKMLILDLIIGCVAAVVLALFTAKSKVVLWCFTAVLGLSFATVTGAKVSWSAKHLPGNNYILSVIMVARCAGSAVIAPTVSILFDVTGPMTLMYSTLISLCAMVILISLVQSIVMRYGVDGKLYNKSEMARLKLEKEVG